MTPEEEHRFVPYLLDADPESDHLEIEERLLANEELLLSVFALEDELVRDYCRGELQPGLHVLFERRLGWDKSLQQKLALTNALLAGALTMGDPSGSAPRRSIFGLFAVFFRVPPLNLAAGGLALALVAGTIWVGIENTRLRNALAAIERTKSALVLENHGLRQSGVPPAEHDGEVAPMRLAFSFPLVPGLSQGQSEPQRIEIPSGAVDVTLQLVLTRPAETDRFRIILRNADDDVVLRSTATTAARTRYLSIRLDGTRLAEGDYSLSLQAGGASGEYQDWESYFFGVLRK